LRALKTSESETGARVKRSEDDEMLEGTWKQLLYTDWKCLENS
jgi:hypothetical protein